MLLALVACASSGENTRTKVGAGAGAATGAVVGGIPRSGRWPSGWARLSPSRRTTRQEAGRKIAA